MLDILFRNARIVLPGEGVIPGSVGVADGRIAAILSPDAAIPAAEVVNCDERFLMPGLIDPHTHFGFGSTETDFRTESRSAALGGVTAAFTFHRSKDLRESVGPWRDLGNRQSCIDFAFHFGLTSKLDVAHLKECADRFGVTSFKFYLMYKGEAGAAKGFHEIDDALLFSAMQQVAGIRGGILGAHCENVEVIRALRPPIKDAGQDDLRAWDAQSPDFLEAENVFRVGYFADKAECPANIVHLSSREGLEVIDYLRSKPRSAPLYVETCTHYLSMTRDWPSPIGKVNPPVRTERDVDALWQAVLDGRIETVGSDHVPRKRATKGPDIWTATAGFPGIATLLPILMHEGYHRRGVPIERIAAVTSANVARLYGVPNKGRIAPGMDADLIVVDPDLERRVDPDTLESFSDYSTYEGKVFKGWPTGTWVRGRKIAADGAILPEIADHPGGRFIVRTGDRTKHA